MKSSVSLATPLTLALITALRGALPCPLAGHLTPYEKHQAQCRVRHLGPCETPLPAQVDAVACRDGPQATAQEIGHHKAQERRGVPAT